MTSLSLVLLFAVAHALVCQASPAYEILEADDEEGVSEGLKLEAPEEQEAVQEQGEEEEKRSSELKADAEELETGLNLDALSLEDEETFGVKFNDASNDLEAALDRPQTSPHWQASPAYEILEADDEEGLSEALKWEGPEEQEAVQEQDEEEDEKRSSELKADAEELETGLVEGVLAPARSRRGIICVRVCSRRICRVACRRV
nr:unnamed protein product [Spirometra erinaceieuropaei]